VNYGRISDFEDGSIAFFSDTSQTSIMQVGPITTNDFDIVEGIDISTHQGNIDWSQIDGGTVQFAYIKASEGDTVVDDQFVANWTNSKGRVLRGPYHYFHPRADPNETTKQTDNFVAVLNRTADIGELPPMVDVETLDGEVGNKKATLTPAQTIASLTRFLKDVEQAFGKRPLVYTFPWFWEHQMGGTNAFAKDYNLWIANYGHERSDGGADRPDRGPLIPRGWTDFHLWQFAVLPGVRGIAGLVDRNTAFVPIGTDLSQFLTRPIVDSLRRAHDGRSSMNRQGFL